MVLIACTQPAMGSYISTDEPLTGGPRCFLSEADLNKIFLGMRNDLSFVYNAGS